MQACAQDAEVAKGAKQLLVSDIRDFSLTKKQVRVLMQQQMEDCLDAAFANAWTGGSLFDWVKSVMEQLIDYRSDVGGSGFLEQTFDPYEADDLVPRFLPEL